MYCLRPMRLSWYALATSTHFQSQNTGSSPVHLAAGLDGAESSSNVNMFHSGESQITFLSSPTHLHPEGHPVSLSMLF